MREPITASTVIVIVLVIAFVYIHWGFQ